MIPWHGFAVGLRIGLLIGLEQKRSKGDGPSRRPAGIRTFALAGLGTRRFVLRVVPGVVRSMLTAWTVATLIWIWG